MKRVLLNWTKSNAKKTHKADGPGYGGERERIFCYKKITIVTLFKYALCYGLKPMPPSNVRVLPLKYLKSGEASCTQTRPISVSTLP